MVDMEIVEHHSIHPEFTEGCMDCIGDRLANIKARLMMSSASSRSYSKDVWTTSDDLAHGWLVASLGADGETGEDVYVVCDGVHASELRGGAKEDGEFIAHAPSDIKFLLQLVDELMQK